MLSLNIHRGSEIIVNRRMVMVDGQAVQRRSLCFIRCKCPEFAAKLSDIFPDTFTIYEIEYGSAAESIVQMLRITHPRAAVMLRVKSIDISNLASVLSVDAVVITDNPGWLPFEYDTMREELAERLNLPDKTFVRICRSFADINMSCAAADIVIRLAGRYGFTRTFVSGKCEIPVSCGCRCVK